MTQHETVVSWLGMTVSQLDITVLRHDFTNSVAQCITLQHEALVTVQLLGFPASSYVQDQWYLSLWPMPRISHLGQILSQSKDRVVQP